MVTVYLNIANFIVVRKEVVLVYSGKMDRTRNLDRMLFGFKDASNNIENLKLILIGGEESDISRLKKIAEKLSINKKVIFIGHVLYKDVPKYLNIADIGISYIPKNEMYDVQPPLKTAEYLACSLPTIATNTAGNREFIVDRHNGVLCSDDPGMFGATIVRLVKDRALFNKIKNNARKSILKYDWKNIINECLLPLYIKQIKELSI